MRIEEISGVKRRENNGEITGYPEDLHVVYFHRDPITRDVVYVGEGRTCRAFTLSNRGEAHFLWLYEQLKSGFSIMDIVEIRSEGYTKDEAKAVERHNIERCLKEGCTLFNVIHNPGKRSNTGSNHHKWGQTIYELISPDGEVIIINGGITAFLKEHGLCSSNLKRVITGQQSSTKGWKARIISNLNEDVNGKRNKLFTAEERSASTTTERCEDSGEVSDRLDGIRSIGDRSAHESFYENFGVRLNSDL